MSQKKVIFSANLQEFRPIIWYGEPVFERYSQLKSIIQEKLGEKYAGFLAEPVISKEVIENKGKAHWMSDYIVKGKAFSELKEQEQEQTRQLLQSIITKIKNFSKELQQSDDSNMKELGELMLLAIEVPSLDNIIVDGEKIVLVLWGFSSEEAKKQNFQINKVIEKPIGVVPPPPVDEIRENINENEKVKIEEQLDEKQNKQEEVKQQNVATENTPPPPPPPNKNNRKKGLPAWLWFLFGALLMFLILFLIWFFLLKDKKQDLLPPESGVLPPVDTTHTGIDPDDPIKRKIFTDKVNVALKKKTNIRAFAEKLAKQYENDLKIIYFDTVIRLIQVQTPEGEWKQWKDSLKSLPEVRLTFNETLFDKGYKPKDPGFSDNQKNWYFDHIKAYEAWEVTKGSPDVVVAVLDNGFDLSHPEFEGKVVKPWNVVTGNDKLFPAGDVGSEHGTHVAGTAVGLENNNGICGIAPECKLMPVQLGNKDGVMTSLAIVAGVLYAIHHEADVINMSLGMMFPPDIGNLPESEQKTLTETLYPEEEQFWDELFAFTEETDIVVVVAAGNQNILAGIDPFARSERILVVAAYNPAKTKANFSNFGSFSTISAPGVQIYSSVPGGNYDYLQGTSMASPIVAGGVALLKSKHPDWTPKQIVDAIIKTAIPINSDKYIGPLIQLDKALNYNADDSVMIIPENPEDLTFAEGKWKSTTDIVNTIDSQKVELYFEIRKNGAGKLTLVEENGNKCYADLEITFEDGKLKMVQKDNAECEEGNKYYRPYQYECEQGDNNVARCKAKEKKGSGELISFKMKKL